MVTLPVLITQQRGSFGLQMTKMNRTQKGNSLDLPPSSVSLSTLDAVLLSCSSSSFFLLSLRKMRRVPEFLLLLM